MEVIGGWTHTAFPVDDPSRVGAARRHAARLASELGFDENDAGRLALVVTELGTNLQRHARHGRLLIAARPHADDVEVLSIDDGPGMPDVQVSLQDGQSSGSTPGTGLGAVRRLATDFDIHSAVPAGTICMARVRRSRRPSAVEAAQADVPSAFQIGAVNLPAPGESVSGDGWSAAMDGSKCTLLLADGLGHGPEAAKASAAASASFGRDPMSGLREMIERVHADLRTTRGAAVCAMTVDAASGQMSYCGAGNIVGRVISGVYDKSIITQHGTAGLQIRRPEQTVIELPPHALMILHSDGIDTRWTAGLVVPVLRMDPALIAAVLLRAHTRQRDDATVVVLRRADGWKRKEGG